MSPESARKRLGQHYTPPALADFLAEQTLAHMDTRRETLRVLDPACGDGALLLAFARVAERRGITASLTLIGFDLDPDAIHSARHQAAGAGVTLDLRAADFLAAAAEMNTGRVDAIVTNPPYVRSQQMGAAPSQALATGHDLRGRVDLAHAFVASLPDLLTPQGVLGLLCSNRFLSTVAGSNIRRTLTERLSAAAVYDLGDSRLFAAAVLPAVVIATKDARARPAPFTTVYSDPEAALEHPGTLFDVLADPKDTVVDHAGRTLRVRTGLLVAGEDVTTPWRLSRPSDDAWLAQVGASTWRTFGDVARVRVGIKTTADSIFIGDDWATRTPTPDAHLLLPLVSSEHLDAWSLRPSTVQVLYPYRLDQSRRTLVDLDAHPATLAYLHAHSERLRAREYVTRGGRQWHEMWVPQRPADWASPKIIFPDISPAPRFALDRSGSIVNGNCYWISSLDIGSEDLTYLMMAVANSSLGLRFYDQTCGNRLYSGRRRWMSQYVSRLPLPHPGQDSRRLIAAARSLTTDPETVQTDDLDELVQQAFGLRTETDRRAA